MPTASATPTTTSQAQSVPKVTYLSWAAHCSRSDNTARELGGKSFMVYYGGFGSRYATILFKYLFQFFASLRLLLRERPDVVFVMSPPIVACLPALVYCWLYKKSYVIDGHTGMFTYRIWQRVEFLTRFLTRRALCTIVTTRHWADKVNEWGGRTFIVPAVPIEPALKRSFGREVEANGGASNADFSVVFVSSFADDEPLDQVLEAARQLPEVRFFVTGKYAGKTHVEPLVASKPENVSFTGFLSFDDYYDLLADSHVVMTLTSRDHIMQRGAYEGIFSGRPIITSRIPLLQDTFPKGSVLIPNETESIAAAVRRIHGNYLKFHQDAQDMRDDMLRAWGETREELLELLRRTV